MSGMQRRKGARAELEVVDLARPRFPHVRRNHQSGGQGGNDLVGIPGLAIEVKCQESLNIWACVAQARENAGPDDWALAFRRNRTSWVGAVDLDLLLALWHQRCTA